MIDVERNEYDISESRTIKTKLDKRYCFKTPEGKFIYACAGSESDSYLVANSERDNQQYFNQDYLNLQYLEENIDFPPEHDADPIELYVINKRIYGILLFIVTGINIAWSTYSLANTRNVITTILTANRVYDIPDGFILFINTLLMMDILIFMVMFMTGLFSLISNKSRLFNYHSMLSIVSMVCVILLSYVHQVYLLAFIVRIMFYIYVRYMVSLLHTILLMPILN